MELRSEIRWTCGWIAVATLTALGAAELASAVLRRPWPETAPIWSYANSIGIAVILFVSAMLLAMRDRTPRLNRAAWMAGYISVALLIVHALAIWANGNKVVLVEIPLALLVGYFLRHSFAPLTPGRRTAEGAAPLYTRWHFPGGRNLNAR